MINFRIAELERNIRDVTEHIANGTNSLLNLHSLLRNLVHLRNLEYEVENAPTVYGWEGSTYWRPIKDAARQTLKARLVMIEKIKDPSQSS